jgi:hypothetical protein
VTVAFVLSGGASLGAVEVGMLKALAQRGITPDLIVGTSVGAVNGAWLAGHPEADVIELERVWASIHRSTVFPADPMLGLFAFAGRRPGLVPQHGLRSLVQGHLTFERIEEAPIPLHLVAVEVLTGQDIRCRDHRWRGRRRAHRPASSERPAVAQCGARRGGADPTPVAHRRCGATCDGSRVSLQGAHRPRLHPATVHEWPTRRSSTGARHPTQVGDPILGLVLLDEPEADHRFVSRAK